MAFSPSEFSPSYLFQIPYCFLSLLRIPTLASLALVTSYFELWLSFESIRKAKVDMLYVIFRAVIG